MNPDDILAVVRSVLIDTFLDDDLEVSRETGYVDTNSGAERLRRRMVERVLTHCETDGKSAEPLLILLRRFATESAREEARLFCEELVADEAHVPPLRDLIAA